MARLAPFSGQGPGDECQGGNDEKGHIDAMFWNHVMRVFHIVRKFTNHALGVGDVTSCPGLATIHEFVVYHLEGFCLRIVRDVPINVLLNRKHILQQFLRSCASDEIGLKSHEFITADPFVFHDVFISGSHTERFVAMVISEAPNIPRRGVFERGGVRKEFLDLGPHSLGDRKIVFQDKHHVLIAVHQLLPQGDMAEGASDAPYTVQHIVTSSRSMFDIVASKGANTRIRVHIQGRPIDRGESGEVREVLDLGLLENIGPSIGTTVQVDTDGSYGVGRPHLT